LNNLGVAYRKSGQFDKAIDAFQRSIHINPILVEVWNNLGVTYGKLKHYDDAIKAFLNALQVDQHYSRARNNLEIAYFNSGNKAAVDAVREK
jgi:tetratricopeptide (TPR) repeat protein